MSEGQKKLNVLHLISTFSPGGAEKLLLYFVKASKRDLTVGIMSDDVDEFLKQELLKTGAKLYIFNKKIGQKHPRFLFRLLKAINENEIDIIHSHDGCVKWSIICKILKPKLKLVYTIHDSIFVKSWGFFKLFINRMFVNMNIAISDEILNDCVKNNLKVIKIYNGIDTKKWKQAHSKNNSFSIINVARISYYKKGHDVLIKALKECKNKGLKFICNFVGEAEENIEYPFENLKHLIDNLELTEEIKFLGNRDDIPELLAQSDLFILPSRYEGMPIALLEAMASRLPIIASNISGSSDLIKHQKNGLLFESENHVDLAEKISYLYEHREEMELLAQNAFEYVQNFDISMMVKKTWNLYQNLMK